VSRLIGMDWEEYLAGLDQYAQKVADDSARRVGKAMALSPNVWVCDALLRGERVPWQALDYFAGERYGLRERHPDGRYTLDSFNDIPAP
jgi:hypothetical protein